MRLAGSRLAQDCHNGLLLLQKTAAARSLSSRARHSSQQPQMMQQRHCALFCCGFCAKCDQYTDDNTDNFANKLVTLGNSPCLSALLAPLLLTAQGAQPDSGRRQNAMHAMFFKYYCRKTLVYVPTEQKKSSRLLPGQARKRRTSISAVSRMKIFIYHLRNVCAIRAFCWRLNLLHGCSGNLLCSDAI